MDKQELALMQLERLAARTPRLYYWAYGSNLNKEAMARRCPDAVPVGPLTLHGRLVFRGVADVTYTPDRRVPGGIWLVSRADEEALDRYEGVSSGLYRKEYIRISVDGREARCLVYLMEPDRYGIAPPSEPYLEVIAQGYRDWGLPMEELERALAESWDDKRLTPRIRRHQARRGGQMARRTHLRRVS